MKMTELANFEIEIDKKKFKVHKEWLAIRCPTLLQSNSKENK